MIQYDGWGGGNGDYTNEKKKNTFCVLFTPCNFCNTIYDFQCSLWDGLVTLLMIPLTTSKSIVRLSQVLCLVNQGGACR